MSGFLIEYDRRTQDWSLREYSGSSGPKDALAARIERERQRENPDLEIVSINADSLETVRRTHSRYFEGRERLAS